MPHGKCATPARLTTPPLQLSPNPMAPEAFLSLSWRGCIGGVRRSAMVGAPFSRSRQDRCITKRGRCKVKGGIGGVLAASFSPRVFILYFSPPPFQVRFSPHECQQAPPRRHFVIVQDEAGHRGRTERVNDSRRVTGRDERIVVEHPWDVEDLFRS